MSKEQRLAYTAMALSALLILMTCYAAPECPMDNFHEVMDLEQIDEQLGEDEARNYSTLGVEVEGTYWWFCDGQWVQIVPPCK